jgi:hypothetical protein
MRNWVEMEGLLDRFPALQSKFQVYKFTKRSTNPMPHKKMGRRLVFDIERVDRWFDSLPGRDEIVDGD